MSIRSDNPTEASLLLTPKEFAEKYNTQLGRIKGGTLCFWGHWFGRPYDNFHEISSVNFTQASNMLVIHFSEQEALTATNPIDIREYSNRLEIVTADRIYWQWYYYGKTRELDKIFYYDITRIGSRVEAITNANWYKPDWSDLTIAKPAVLLT